MRPALSGLLDGLLSRGGLLMPTRAWTLTLISLVTRRWKSPFPPTVLESQTPRLRSAPLLLLRLPLLPRTPKLLCIILLVFFFFFFVGLRTPDICDAVLNEYFIFYLIVPFFSFFFFFFFCNCFPDAALSSAVVDRQLYGLCLSS